MQGAVLLLVPAPEEMGSAGVVVAREQGSIPMPRRVHRFATLGHVLTMGAKSHAQTAAHMSVSVASGPIERLTTQPRQAAQLASPGQLQARPARPLLPRELLRVRGLHMRWGQAPCTKFPPASLAAT